MAAGFRVHQHFSCLEGCFQGWCRLAGTCLQLWLLSVLRVILKYPKQLGCHEGSSVHCLAERSHTSLEGISDRPFKWLLLSLLIIHRKPERIFIRKTERKCNTTLIITTAFTVLTVFNNA
jgi:hypothetical protein